MSLPNKQTPPGTEVIPTAMLRGMVRAVRGFRVLVPGGESKEAGGRSKRARAHCRSLGTDIKVWSSRLYGREIGQGTHGVMLRESPRGLKERRSVTRDGNSPLERRGFRECREYLT